MSDTPSINLLLVLTVAGEQVTDLIRRLSEAGLYATLIDSRGGLVEERTSTLLTGIRRSDLDQALTVIRDACKRHRRLVPAQLETPSLAFQPLMIETETGGALLYALEIEALHRL
jgi:uncharacterized protein YaaQ